MPCYDPDADREAADRLRVKVDELTNLLCLACSTQEPIHEAVKKWWRRHQKADEKRRQREHEEAEYLKELTAWEAKRPKRRE